MKFLKNTLIWFLFAICFILIIEFGLYIHKYYTTKDIYETPENSYNIKMLKNKSKFFRYGSNGNYPILQISTDNKNWETINMRGVLFDAIPLESRYDNFQSLNNTIWFYHLKSCIECDCSNIIYNIYYSHDNGNTWDTIETPNACTFVSFENDKDGTMIYNEGKILHTHDGGKTWKIK